MAKTRLFNTARSDGQGELTSEVSFLVFDRLRPALLGCGLSMEDYWVWCGSVIRGEDGRYHMFASRWPKSLPFWAGYAVASEVVRATSDSPAGPYEFREVVLPARGEQFWDGRMTHNPTIQKSGDTYLLYYIGATYDGPVPTGQKLLVDRSVANRSWSSIRIGLATANSVDGPWTRRAEPILGPVGGSWETNVVTNPAPCVDDDGSVLMIYRTSLDKRLALGVARAEQFDGPYERIAGPVRVFGETGYVEDPFIWRCDSRYEMLAKDMTGGITGEKHAGVHALSRDGIDWQLAPEPKAYSRKVVHSDGTSSTLGCLERPQLLIEEGVPTHLFLAAADGPGGFDNALRSWNQAIALQP